METKTDRQLLKDANEIIRSFHSVCERRGLETNWEGLTNKVKGILKEQHSVLYPSSGNISKNKTQEINPTTIAETTVEWSFLSISERHDSDWAEWTVEGSGNDGSYWLGSTEAFASNPEFENEITDIEYQDTIKKATL